MASRRTANIHRVESLLAEQVRQVGVNFRTAQRGLRLLSRDLVQVTGSHNLKPILEVPECWNMDVVRGLTQANNGDLQRFQGV